MSELTLTVVRLGLLVLLWVFVFSVASALRGDLYGTRVSSARQQRRDSRAPARSQATRTPTPTPRRRSNTPRELVVTDGPLRGTTLPLRGNGILIGRNPECALILDDDFASSRHARIFPDGETWWVEDLGSTNGTFLNTERLTEPMELHPGSELRIGRTIIEVRR